MAAVAHCNELGTFPEGRGYPQRGTDGISVAAGGADQRGSRQCER